MADPLTLLGYTPQQALPALQARPPALSYLGSDRANQALYDYAQPRTQAAPPTVTSAGLPDIEGISRNVQAAYTERLKARREQERILYGVVDQLGKLNPRSNDYLNERSKLLQAVPWAAQSKDVQNILAAQEDVHKEHIGEIKSLGEFQHDYQTKYNAHLKEGKAADEAHDLAMDGALMSKARIDFIEQGAPKEVVNKVFKPDGTFDRAALAEWKGEQKRMEFDKKMAGDKGGFIPISQDESKDIVDAVDDTLKNPDDAKKIDAYNKANGTAFTTKNATKEVWDKGFELAKKNADAALRRMVNKLALSGKKIPKALEKYVDGEQATDDLDKVLEKKFSGGETAPAPKKDDAVNFYLQKGKQSVKK